MHVDEYIRILWVLNDISFTKNVIRFEVHVMSQFVPAILFRLFVIGEC